MHAQLQALLIQARNTPSPSPPSALSEPKTSRTSRSLKSPCRCVQQDLITGNGHNLSFSPLPLPLVFLLVCQEASQRSLERCSEAEGEVETLRSRLAELEGRDSGRDAVVALEIKVDELEEVICRLLLFTAVVQWCMIYRGAVVFAAFSKVLPFCPLLLVSCFPGCLFFNRCSLGV